MMDAITIFGESNFHIWSCGYGLATKSVGLAGSTSEEVAEKTKCQKMNVKFFTTKLG
jgi:hypothetical protein